MPWQKTVFKSFRYSSHVLELIWNIHRENKNIVYCISVFDKLEMTDKWLNLIECTHGRILHFDNLKYMCTCTLLTRKKIFSWTVKIYTNVHWHISFYTLGQTIVETYLVDKSYLRSNIKNYTMLQCSWVASCKGKTYRSRNCTEDQHNGTTYLP